MRFARHGRLDREGARKTVVVSRGLFSNSKVSRRGGNPGFVEVLGFGNVMFRYRGGKKNEKAKVLQAAGRHGFGSLPLLIEPWDTDRSLSMRQDERTSLLGRSSHLPGESFADKVSFPVPVNRSVLFYPFRLPGAHHNANI
jgi:hypothetical protein